MKEGVLSSLIHGSFFDKLASSMMMARTYSILCALVLLGITVHAQQTEPATKLRLAQSFEQAGEWARAALLYESLLEGNQRNFVVLDGLRRAYTELKQYDKAIRLVSGQLRVNPTDENLLTVLGGLYDLAGQPQRADSLWRLVIKKDVKNAGLYRLVATQLIDHRQYERAIGIYLEGRAQMGNDNLYIEELAALYGALHQYDSATREFVKIVRVNPQQGTYVQSRLASFTGRPEGRLAALGVVIAELNREPQSVPLHSVLAWLRVEGKEYGQALEQYRIIDRLTKANGLEIFQFGQRAAQERAYSVAAQAFREVIEGKPGSNLRSLARFGYARATEELSVLNDSLTAGIGGAAEAEHAGDGTVSETKRSLRGALDLYERIIADYPHSDVAMQALFRIGTIYYLRLYDLDGAAAAFEKVRTMPFNVALQHEAILNLAEVQTAKGELNHAREEYSRLLAIASEQERDRALFRLAELDYFEGKIDSAVAKLERISRNIQSDQTNDALQLFYFIQENSGSGQIALREFARAELLARQRKHSEALSAFQSLTTRYPATSLVDDGVLKIAELQLVLGHVREALAVLQRIVTDMTASVLRDRAQMRMGEIYETKLKDKASAIEAYERLLEQFPASLFAEEARKRVRALRGDPM
jgi:tetratricopeptide (TPR) repeat protein